MDPGSVAPRGDSETSTNLVVTIRPKRRTEAGVGVYERSAPILLKQLRRAGVSAVYEDPPHARRFEDQNSAAVDLVNAIAVSVASSAAYEGLKWALRRMDSEIRFRLRLLDEGLGTEALLEGSPQDMADQLPGLEAEAVAQSTVPAPSTEVDIAELREVRLSPARTVESRLEAGEALMLRARELLGGSPAEAEVAARDALERFASALNWAEDSAFEEAAHARMDTAGRWVRRTFGCQLDWDGTTYHQRCPVALGHNRVGLSTGGLSVKVCSICGEDFAECEHAPGRRYRVEGGLAPLGWCRVCLEKDPCEHLADETYGARVVSIVVDMELEETSYVARPAHRDARLTSTSFSAAELRERLGEDFESGVLLACNKCLRDCAGLTQFPDGTLAEA